MNKKVWKQIKVWHILTAIAVIFLFIFTGFKYIKPVQEIYNQNIENIPAWQKYKTLSGKAPQFVILSFDGSRSIDFWNESLKFEGDMNTAGKPLKFTYFIS